MKKTQSISWLLFILFSLPAILKAQDFEWVKQFGSSGNKASGTKIVTDRSGNVFTLGTFSGTVDFDPGSGTFSLNSGTVSSAFISKLDSSGGFLWAKSLGDAAGADITVDKYGNSFIIGTFSYTVDIDPGPASSTISAYGSPSTFILKLDPIGNFIWVKTFINGYIHCTGESIAIDSAQSIYGAGHFMGGPVDFDPGLGTYLANSTFHTYSNGIITPLENYFLVKLDSSGAFVFVTTGGAFSSRVVVNSLDESILFGSFSSLIKSNPNGGVLWNKYLFASVPNNLLYSNIISATTDRSNNVYVLGYFRGTADFDPGPGTVNRSSPNGVIGSTYIFKLDNAGNFVDVQLIDDTPHASVMATQVITDASGAVYIAGSFKGIIDFDPNPWVKKELNSVDGSGFILRLDKDGWIDWVKQIGENSTSTLNSIALDDFGNLYGTGSFTGAVDFDPGSGINNLTASGISDAFVHKLGGPIITGMTEEVTKNEISIFPNPTASMLYLNVATNLNRGICRLVDVSGKVVQEKNNINGTSFAIDVSGQAKGLYILEISDAKTISRIKLIKD